MRLSITMSFVVAMLMSQSSWAAMGNDGGGGARLEAAFRVRAFQLITRISQDQKANNYCAAETMQNALDHSDVRVVALLIDPKTSQPVDRDFDAWSMPGDIQLLKSSWEHYLVADTWMQPKVSDVLIIHEVYRTTSTCNDEHFVISSKVYGLIEGSK